MRNATSNFDPVPVAADILGPGEGRRIPPGDDPFVTVKVERRHSGGTMTAYEATVAPAAPVRLSTSTGPGMKPSASSRAR
jgi:hypothetical protein